MYCILGQGLAGTILAFRLKASGIPFKIIDNGHKNSSSLVAAGLWNPIVFRRINKSWMADEFLDELERFYPEMEAVLGEKFYYPIRMGRAHNTKWEHDTWFEKKGLPGYKPYLTDAIPDWNPSSFKEMPFGAHLIEKSGHLNTPLFLQTARRYFHENGDLIESQIDLPDSVEELAAWQFSGFKFEKIIDCRGYRSAHSNWWNYLPFGLTKGETLTVKCPGLNLYQVFNSGFFVLPLGDNLYRVGATFNWDEPTQETTEKGKKELLEKFKNAINLPVEVVNHQAGVRPTIQDRKPLFGQHPKAQNLYIFNGLGAKGVMIAPYFSTIFLDFLRSGKGLPKETNVARFEELLGQVNPQINHPVR